MSSQSNELGLTVLHEYGKPAADAVVEELMVRHSQVEARQLAQRAALLEQLESGELDPAEEQAVFRRLSSGNIYD